MRKDIWFEKNIYDISIKPCSWQGWATIIVFSLFMIVLFANMEKYPTKTKLIEFYFYFFTAILAFVYIIVKKGEKGDRINNFL